MNYFFKGVMYATILPESETYLHLEDKECGLRRGTQGFALSLKKLEPDFHFREHKQINKSEFFNRHERQEIKTKRKEFPDQHDRAHTAGKKDRPSVQE